MKNYWEGKKVAITGASGFLGSHFVSELLGRKAKVLAHTKKRLDLLNPESTNKAMKSVDLIINCAALDGNSEFKKNHPAQILDCNLRIASNILNAAKANNINDVVLVSSAEIYSPTAPNPIKEEDDYRVFNGYTDNGYILSKRFSEILANLYQKEFGLRIYLPRPSNIYGPGDHFDERSTRVIPSFINKIVAGKSIEIWGDGSQIRQFIYVKDVVRSILTMIEKGHADKLNIATNEFVSILDLAKSVFKYLGVNTDIRLDKTKTVGVQNRILDTSKMNQLIDFSPISLEAGLSETIKWYKKKFRK